MKYDEYNINEESLGLPEIIIIYLIKYVFILSIFSIIVMVWVPNYNKPELQFINPIIIFLSNYIVIKTSKDLKATEKKRVNRIVGCTDIFRLSFLVIGVCIIVGAGIYGFFIVFDQSRLYYPQSVYGTGYYLLIYGGIVGPILEELVFRKKLINLLTAHGYVVAVIVQGFIFGVEHGIKGFFYAAMVGMILGACYLLSGNIVWGVILHIINNAVLNSMYLLLYEKYGVLGLGIMLIVGILLVCTYFVLYFNVKDKKKIIKNVKHEYFQEIAEEKKLLKGIFTDPALIIASIVALFVLM